MLRRAGVMNQECYEHNLIPTTEDTGDALRSKWLKWAELESFKRLTYPSFLVIFHVA